jgi:hypothetical protein
MFFVSFYRLLDDSNVILEESDQAEGGSPECSGTINFGASMSVTADESDAPSDEETAYHSKRSRRN